MLEEELIKIIKGLKPGGKVKMQAMSSSMKPVINPQDKLWLIRVKLREVRVGDVVAYVSRKQKKIIVHRVVKKTRGRLEVKGDSQSESDEERVARSNFLGKVKVI